MSLNQRGFTLAEVMVSVAILGMIGALTVGTFARSMNAKDQAGRITGYYRDIRQAMQRMEREISMAYLSEHRDCEDARNRTIFKGDRGLSSGRLDFTSFSHQKMARDSNESDQNEISYYIGDNPDGEGKVLLRRVQSPIDEEPEEGGKVEVLSVNISGLEFSFYDENEDRWESEWDSTRQETRRRVPMFVSVTATAKGLDGKDEEFTSKTRIFLRQPIKIFGTGAPTCVND